MRQTNHAKVLAALKARGQATAREIAADLGWTNVTASRHLGDLFCAGHLQRDKFAAPGGTFQYVYRDKDAKGDAHPPTPIWKPVPRFAQSLTDRDRSARMIAREADRLMEQIMIRDDAEAVQP